MDHVDNGSPPFDMNWAFDPTQFTSRPASDPVRRVRPTANTLDNVSFGESFKYRADIRPRKGTISIRFSPRLGDSDPHRVVGDILWTSAKSVREKPPQRTF